MTNPTDHAYEILAPQYDQLTESNDYESWFSLLLPEVERRGLRHGRVLDVGCGTGRAFPPMLDRGWRVWGVDASPPMLEQARQKFGDRVTLAPADARQLPRLGEFELIISLNDVINYCTEDGDLERIFGGMRDNLAEGGRICFDLSSLRVFHANFMGGESEWMGDQRLNWRGIGDSAEPGAIFEAEVFGDSFPTHLHRERHWTRDDVLSAFDAVGLECLGEVGHDEVEGEGIVFNQTPDEERDHRVIYVAGARASSLR
jgi:SAM-dependent methyltransferase